MAATDISSPMSMAPASPMKILAGLKLWGKKPRQAPSSSAISIAEKLEWSNWLMVRASI